MGWYNKMLEDTGFDRELDRQNKIERRRASDKHAAARSVLEKISKGDRELIEWHFRNRTTEG